MNNKKPIHRRRRHFKCYYCGKQMSLDCHGTRRCKNCPFQCKKCKQWESKEECSICKKVACKYCYDLRWEFDYGLRWTCNDCFNVEAIIDYDMIQCKVCKNFVPDFYINENTGICKIYDHNCVFKQCPKCEQFLKETDFDKCYPHYDPDICISCNNDADIYEE